MGAGRGDSRRIEGQAAVSETLATNKLGGAVRMRQVGASRAAFIGRRSMAGADRWRMVAAIAVVAVRACCDGLGNGGRIPTIVAGPRVPAGRDPTPYTHYSLLRSIEAAFGLPFLGHAGDPVAADFPAVANAARGAR